MVDVLGTIPFELLLSGSVLSRKSLKLTKYFKIPKLLRVSRVMKYVRNHKHVYDFTKVLLVTSQLSIGACIWVSTLDPCDDTRTNYAGMDVCSQENVFRIYSEALHISATMLLGVSNFHIVGKPELINLDFEGRPEHATKVYLLSTAYMIVGLFVIALLMSEANVYLMGKMQGSAAFQRKTDRVNHEMEYYGVPPDLQRQVRAFYDYVWIHQRQYDEKIALLSDAQMSTDLQRKLALHLFKDVISHISFFSEIDDLLLSRVCLSLRTRIFLPGDMILFKGDVGKELFIISKGVVEVLRDDLPAAKRRSAPKILLQNGSFFGEIALVMEVRRTCSVQARTVCEVNILQQDAFDAIVRENPHFARRMNELVVARQLDSRLALTQQKGVDFQVSQSDLDLAVEAMERSMMEGLERRNNPSSTTNSTALSDSSHRSNFRSDQHSSSSNKVFSPMRVSFENCCSPDDESAVDEESLLNRSTRGSGPRTSNASTAEKPVVTDVLQDIARRSTRFPDEDYIEKIRRNASPNRPLSELIPESNDISDNADICSDGEIKAPKERVVRRRRGTSHISNVVHKSERITTSNNMTATTDEESERLTGHFTPGRCAVDIAKVRPVILQNNNQTEQVRRRAADGDVSSLGARLSQQSKLMETLLAKVEGLERARKSQKNEGRNES